MKEILEGLFGILNKELKTRLQTFKYAHVIRFSISMEFAVMLGEHKFNFQDGLEFTINNPDWKESEEFFHNTFMSYFYKSWKLSIESQHHSTEEKVEMLYDLKFDEHFGFGEMLAWNCDEVATWFIEQERGEHWIVLPRNYERPTGVAHNFVNSAWRE